MSKTIQEQIEVMQHFANGGFIDIKNILDDEWSDCVNPQWNWNNYDYRIVEQKKAVTIEKWVVYKGLHKEKPCFEIIEGNKEFFESYYTEAREKLLHTYEVEL